MALTNCSINTGALTKIGGQAIGSDNINLTITPNQHHSVTASNFSVGTIPAGVSSITITDNGSAGSFANTLNVLVNLTDTFTMPSANTTITVDVDGAADKGEVIQRTIYVKEDWATGSNFTGTFSSGPDILESSGAGYSNVTGTKTVGQNVHLFTRTLTCASGYYFPQEPTYVITSNDENHIPRYSIETTRTYLENGELNLPLTIISFKVYYLVPDDNVVAGDLDCINFSTAQPAIIYSATREITNFLYDSTNLGVRGAVRVLTVYGTTGAAFNLNVVDAASTRAVVNGVHTGEVIGPKGFNSYAVTFPTSYDGSGYDNVTYNITITTATSNPTTSLGSSISTSTPMYTLQQVAPVTLSLTKSNLLTGLTATLPSSVAKVFSASSSVPDGTTDGQIPWDFDVSVASPYIVKKRRDAIDTDFVKTTSGASTFLSGLIKGSVTETTDQLLSFNLVYNVIDSGSASETFNIDLTNVINTPPVSGSQTGVAVAHNTAKTISLVGTDADGDTLTWSIVTNASKGTASVVSGTGVATYTPNSGSVGHDSFTYKVNDTYQDSTIGSISVVIATGGGSGNPTSSFAWAWNDSEENNNWSLLTGTNQGTASVTGITTGSNSVVVAMSAWTTAQNIVPSYVNNIGDIKVYNQGGANIQVLLKYGGSTLATVTRPIVGTVNEGNHQIALQSNATIAVPSTHNSGSGLISGAAYTIEFRERWENLLQ